MYAQYMTPAVELFRAVDLPYREALTWQRDRVVSVRAGGAEAFALIQHAPVYTMGRRGGRDSVRQPLEALPAPLVDIERGGDLTWHGPGQLVGYPILDLRRRNVRPADYVRALETLLVEVLDRFGVVAAVVPGRPGVWVDGAKIAAIGVAIRGGVSLHGFALNVAPDLSWYDPIVPCGIVDASVTSMERIRPPAPPLAEVAAAVVDAAARQLQLEFADEGQLLTAGAVSA